LQEDALFAKKKRTGFKTVGKMAAFASASFGKELTEEEKLDMEIRNKEIAEKRDVIKRAARIREQIAEDAVAAQACAEEAVVEERRLEDKELEAKDRLIGKYRKVFKSYDRDEGGTISMGELGALMVALGSTPTPEELEAVMASFDQDGDGTIGFDEFLMVMGVNPKPEEEAPREEEAGEGGFKAKDSGGGLMANEFLLKMRGEEVDEVMDDIQKAETETEWDRLNSPESIERYERLCHIMKGRSLGLRWTQSSTFLRMMAQSPDFRRFTLAARLWVLNYLTLARKLEKKSHAAMNQERLSRQIDLLTERDSVEVKDGNVELYDDFIVENKYNPSKDEASLLESFRRMSTAYATLLLTFSMYNKDMSLPTDVNRFLSLKETRNDRSLAENVIDFTCILVDCECNPNRLPEPNRKCKRSISHFLRGGDTFDLKHHIQSLTEKWPKAGTKWADLPHITGKQHLVRKLGLRSLIKASEGLSPGIEEMFPPVDVALTRFTREAKLIRERQEGKAREEAAERCVFPHTKLLP